MKFHTLKVNNVRLLTRNLSTLVISFIDLIASSAVCVFGFKKKGPKITILIRKKDLGNFYLLNCQIQEYFLLCDLKHEKGNIRAFHRLLDEKVVFWPIIHCI